MYYFQLNNFNDYITEEIDIGEENVLQVKREYNKGNV